MPTLSMRCPGRLRAACLLLCAAATAASAAAQEADPAPRPKRVPQYKRVHQKVVRSLIDGDTARATRTLAEHVEKHGKDAESQFVAAMVLAADPNSLEAAVGAAREALELGLPPGRFLAEPRRFLEPLLADAELRATLDAAVGGLVHGPTLGDLQSDRVRVWVRTAEPARVEIVASPVDGKSASVAATARSRIEDACTAVVQLAGLKSATRYRYRVLVDDEEEAQGDEVGRFEFRTPAADGEPQLRIAFGGGAGFVPAHERVWRAIAGRSPDLLLLLGDTIYSDDPTRPELQSYCYSRRQSRPEWRELVARVPVYAIWDDHDFGTNDCEGGATADQPPWKPAVFELFARNWPNPDYGHGGALPGCWFGFQRGDISFTMLDGRSYRVRKRAKEPTMLGSAQRAWLDERIASVESRLHVLCSPVPWTFLAKGDSPDTWNGFRPERDEILSSFAAREAAGGPMPLLLSADRHRSDAWWVERDDGQPWSASRQGFHELNSSRLTNQHVHPEMRAALLSYNRKQSFGLAEIATSGAEITARYVVVDLDGVTRASLSLRP